MMTWDLKTVLQWMLDNGYGILVNGEFVITNKVKEALMTGPVSPSPMPVTTAVATRTTAIIPKVSNPDDRKAIWNKFILDADIPHRVSSPTSGSSYTVRQYGPAAANKLIQIIKDPSVNYDIFVQSTKHYYKTVSFKALLSNYLSKDIWKGEYDEWVKNKGAVKNHQENRFED